MGLHDWKAKFAPAILERGENYFHNGAVRSLEWEDEQIHAVVSGERDYHVHISVINGVASHMFCDCPFARRGNYCKHMAAVLFAAFDDACREAEKYVSSRKHLMDNIIPVLLLYGRPGDAADAACDVFAEASEAGFDCSDEPFKSLYEDCEKHWRAIWPHMSQSQRSIIFEWLFAYYSRWNASKKAIEWFLFGNSSQEPAFLEPEFLRRELDLLDTEIQESGTKEADLNRLVKLRLDTMKRIPVEQAEIARYTQEYYRVPSIRQQLIEDAIRERRWKDAIMVLRNSKTIDGENTDYVRKHSEKLIELYQTLGFADELKSELLYYLKRFYQDDFHYVYMLKSVTLPQDWSKMMEHIMSFHSLPNMRDDLLMKDKQYKRLLEYVIVSEDAFLMDKHFEILSKLYPDEVRKFYVACLRAEMAKACKRSRYTDSGQTLKDVKPDTRRRTGRRRSCGRVADNLASQIGYAESSATVRILTKICLYDCDVPFCHRSTPLLKGETQAQNIVIRREIADDDVLIVHVLIFHFLRFALLSMAIFLNFSSFAAR